MTRFLSLNIGGLPHLAEELVDLVRPEHRVRDLARSVAPLADVAVFQEVWERDQRKKLAKAFGAPKKAHHWPKVDHWHPWLRALGIRGRAGLCFVARHPFEVTAKGGFTATTLSKWDFLSTKGWAAARIGRVVFVTAHLDAGRDADSVAARQAQLYELAAGIYRLGRGPVALGGDLNLKDDEPNDLAQLHAFLRATGLDVALHRSKDVVAARGLEVVESEVIPTKRLELSDHDGMAVRFRVLDG